MRVVVPFNADGSQPRCTVAVLAALGVPGVPARKALNAWDVLDRLREAGLRYALVPLSPDKPTVADFVQARAGKPGRFYFWTSRHALALIDGDTLVDTLGRGLSDRVRVLGAFEVT